MVRTTSVDDNGIRKGAWSKEEDAKLRAYIQRYGHWNWRLLPKFAGLARTGKSCRLRWMNYLKPGLKRGNFSQNEHDMILKLHANLGKKWSAMALEMPGRTDNEIKNYWYGHISKRHPAGRTILNEELVIEPAVLENLLLESYEVPTSQASSSTHNRELVVSPHSSSDDSTAESETPDFWKRPFELDTDTYIGEKSSFWTDLMHTEIHAQDSNFPPFLEEVLLSPNARYNDFSNFDYAVNPFLIHSWQNDRV